MVACMVQSAVVLMFTHTHTHLLTYWLVREHLAAAVLPGWLKKCQLGYFWQSLAPYNLALAPCYFWATFSNTGDHFHTG